MMSCCALFVHSYKTVELYNILRSSTRCLPQSIHLSVIFWNNCRKDDFIGQREALVKSRCSFISDMYGVKADTWYHCVTIVWARVAVQSSSLHTVIQRGNQYAIEWSEVYQGRSFWSRICQVIPLDSWTICKSRSKNTYGTSIYQ